MPTLTIVDEAHHAAADTWGKVFEAFPSLRLGVTATPIRKDGKGLNDVFDAITIGAEVQELIDLGYLVQPVIYCPSVIDVTGVRTQAGDFVTSQLEKAADKPSITGDAVEHYKKLADGVPTVVFCVSRKHTEHVAEQFRNAGYAAHSVDGMTDSKERERILAGLGNGTAQVVCSCDLIGEGTDIPAIGCVIMLRPTQSLGLYLQWIGRALRPCAGKDRAIVLDHAGNVLRHGLPEESREWSLEGSQQVKKKKKEGETAAPVKQCVACYAVFKPAPKCPECGAEVKIQERKLEVKEGELVALDKEALKRQRYQESLQQKKEVWGAKTLDDLLNIERARGYKKGWAQHIWTARVNKNLSRNY